MCICILVGDAECDNLAQLREALNGGIVIGGDGEHNCLCNVDLDATAQANGLKKVVLLEGICCDFVPIEADK